MKYRTDKQVITAHTDGRTDGDLDSGFFCQILSWNRFSKWSAIGLTHVYYNNKNANLAAVQKYLV